MKFIRSIFALFFVLLFHAGFAQYYNLNFRNFNSSNGLPGNDVECLYQDSRGFIWVGTRFGLSMFDGSRFRNFSHDPKDVSSLGGSRVFKIQEDGRGRLWVATENFGLSAIDLKTFRIKNYPIPAERKLEDRFINTLYIDESGLIWIGAETGISYFDPVKGVYHKVKIETTSRYLETVSFAKDMYGTLWAASYTGQIFYKKKNENYFRDFKHSWNIDLIHLLINIPENPIYITTTSGIFELNPDPQADKSSLKRFEIFGSKSNITTLSIDKGGIWWIANSEKGIQFYDPVKKDLKDLNISWLSPIDPGIADWKDILIDQNGGIWLGGEYGLYHYNSKLNKFNIYKAIVKFNEQFSFGKYMGISNFDEEIITVAFRGVSIFDRNRNDFITLEYSNDLQSKPVGYYGIIQTGKFSWWIPTSTGVLELIRKNNSYILRRSEKLKSHPVLGRGVIYGISASSDGKFWFATPQNGLMVYDKYTGQIQSILEFGTGSSKRVIDHFDFVTASPEGDIAVGHHRGFVVKFHDEKDFVHIEQLVNEQFDFSKLSVYDMEYMGDYLWVASESDGLLRFDFKKGKLKIFTMDDGLISNSITSIHGMGNDRIVIGTNKGMSVMHIPTETFTTYLKKDGLPSEEFEIAVDHDINRKEFFMATTKGIVSFNANELQQTVIRPRLLLYAIVRNGIPLSDSLVDNFRTNPNFKLKYNESLNLQFSTLNYSNDNDFILRFKMREEEEWQTSSNPESLSLFNLDAGVYNIVIQLVGKRSGIMSEQIKVKLEVLPFFFKTRLFRFLLLSLILLVLYFPVNSFFQKRLATQQRELEKKQLLEQERVRIAMDLHDDIGGNLTALTLMTSLLKEKEVGTSGKLLVEKIGEASDKMVQDMNEIVWALNSTNDSLSSLMSYIRQQISQKLSEADIIFEISEPLSYPEMYVSGRARRNIYMIIKEVVNNAVKYADTRIIEMKVVLDRTLKITISDNGKGMPNELTNQTIRGGGNGLNNIRKRTDMLGASVYFKNEKGVTAIFEIPLDRFNI